MARGAARPADATSPAQQITEADWRLFPTLVRFDEVYHVHFRCNYRRIVEYPNLWAYTRELYQLPGVAPTVAMDQIKRHYYTTHDELNPKHIIPLGSGPGLVGAARARAVCSRGEGYGPAARPLDSLTSSRLAHRAHRPVRWSSPPGSDEARQPRAWAPPASPTREAR